MLYEVSTRQLLAGLDRLDLVAEAGHGHDQRGLGLRDDVDLVLTDADRLDSYNFV